MNDKILQDFYNGFFTGMILTDLQKGFDTIDHNILLEKLKRIDFCDNTVNYFHSYLTDGAFLVSIENKNSYISKISCGVPRGSVLGLLLFTIYVNDIKQAVPTGLLLYADDSCLVFQHKQLRNNYLRNNYHKLEHPFCKTLISILYVNGLLIIS